MIIFPQIAKNVVLMVADDIYSSCSRECAPLGGVQWVFTESVRDALRTLVGLSCVPGEYSVSSLADLIMDLNYDFEGEC